MLLSPRLCFFSLFAIFFASSIQCTIKCEILILAIILILILEMNRDSSNNGLYNIITATISITRLTHIHLIKANMQWVERGRGKKLFAFRLFFSVRWYRIGALAWQTYLSSITLIAHNGVVTRFFFVVPPIILDSVLSIFCAGCYSIRMPNEKWNQYL